MVFDGRPSWLTPRGRQLFDKYALQSWSGVFSKETWRETLAVLELLDRVPGSEAFAPRLLDVGSKNWRYLPALVVWLAARCHGTGPREIHGVEIDAYRMYSDFRTRLGCARWFSERFSESGTDCVYRPGDVRQLTGSFDVITWLFPFVIPGPHLAWGLPPSLFDPVTTFRHVESLLAPGGSLIMANQGEWEWRAARPLFSSLRRVHQEELSGSLHPSPHPIFLSVWAKGS